MYDELEHKPILTEEIVKNLITDPDGIYVDMTLGDCGHFLEIKKNLSNKAILIGFDVDLHAFNKAQKKLSKLISNCILINSNFKYLKQELTDYKIFEITGLLYDLGLSSMQIDAKARGFSFQNENEKLDMRFDLSLKKDASYYLNNLTFTEWKNIFKRCDLKLFASKLANNIIKKQPFITTAKDLNKIIELSIPKYLQKQKKYFQLVYLCVRILVNNELENFSASLNSGLTLLKVFGKCCILTFNSLEEKVIFNTLKKLNKDFFLQKNLKKFIFQDKELIFFHLSKPIQPKPEEIAQNSRARSAKLWVITKKIERI
ncbi:16S rRNA (cytosine(1402)-N(4))-methyltransferase RsmH [symbiont of Argiope bruennichi]|uniref:16S rRNA (cytosine(1402)-N(4))-methyltransferase RsmH n=1 Tax=symbiont of Argiope bruennichi TaxID=2810479 RepID=UPI003DA46387